VLRRIFETKKEGVTGSWRNLLNKRLHNLYSMANIRMIKSERMSREEDVENIRGIRNGCTILVGKPVGKKRLKRKEDDEIKIYFK
jgi:hypothetical protein